MSTWEPTSYYFSGQGVILIGARDPSTGKPMGLTPIGNVSDLKLSVTTSTLEHKESTTGQRATDLRLTTETKCALSMTVENFIAENFRIALRGSSTNLAGASVVAEATKGYFGKVSPLKYMEVSAVAVKSGATALTAYTNDATPYDYRLNTEAGSVMINDGSVTPLAILGTTVSDLSATAMTAGATTTVTVTNTLVPGQRVVIGGVTGADAALVNGKACTVLTAVGANFTVDINTAGKTIVGTSAKVWIEGGSLTVDYTYGAQKLVDALTLGSQEMFMRFEGLNTADNNAPVVVEVFKFLVDPLKELALISDSLQQYVIEGSVLSDPLQLTGSKFFRQLMSR